MDAPPPPRLATLHRVVRFRARHCYRLPELSLAENRARFGAQADPHEHEFTVEVAVRGPMDRRTGFVVDLTVLDRLLATRVVDVLDGTSLNDAADVFRAGRPLPSTEGLARWIWERVAPAVPGPASLVRVRVAEDETLWSVVESPED